MLKQFVTGFVVAFLITSLASAQEKPLDMKMDFEEYDPPSSLKVEEHGKIDTFISKRVIKPTKKLR